jgi:hypothetical protein
MSIQSLVELLFAYRFAFWPGIVVLALWLWQQSRRWRRVAHKGQWQMEREVAARRALLARLGLVALLLLLMLTAGMYGLASGSG